MIRSVFLPERIGNFYLVRSRRVGIEITERAIYATTLVLAGRSRTIDGIFQEKIVQDTTIPFDERVISALKSLRYKIGTYDHLTFAVSSSNIIFKDLSLPFIGRRKIKLVVPFEVESLLPFSLEAGVIDSIITMEDTTDQKTAVLVAALKKENIDQIERYFREADMRLDKVSVDIFDLYGIFQMAYAAHAKKQVRLLLECGATRTTLGLIINDRLAYIRSFPSGIHGTKEMGNTPTNELPFDAQTKKNISKILEDVMVTVDATLPKLAPSAVLDEIILTGMAADLPGISDEVHTFLRAPVEIMNVHTLLSSGVLTTKVATIPNAAMVSIAASAVPFITEEFTLLQEKAVREEAQELNYQLITIATLTGFLFLSFSVYSFFRVRSLRKAYRDAEIEAISELKKQFKLRPQQLTRLEFANKAAQAELTKQETAWRRISPDNRYAYLKYLIGLTRCINMPESQLQLSSIILKDDTIKLYGSVPGYPQLNKLQSQLECPLFKRVPKLQDKNFMSEPITLTINPEEF